MVAKLFKVGGLEAVQRGWAWELLRVGLAGGVRKKGLL